MEYLSPEKATKLRIFTEPTGNGIQWSIDATDGKGSFTEACWSFDTYSEAYSACPEFTQTHVPHLAPCGYLTKSNEGRR